MDQLLQLLSSNISLIIAVAALVTAFFQWRKSVAEANAFRQQLVSILHHAEGVSTNLRSIVFPGPDQNQTFSTVNDVRKAVNGAFQSSEALFFGLLETKVGGKSIKNDLDRKYAQWAELNLDQKMLGVKTVIASNPLVQTTVNTVNNDRRHLLTDLQKLLIIVKNYFINS